MSGLRRPSQDYQLLALEAKLETLKLDPIEQKEREAVFNEMRTLVDKYINDRAEKLPLRFNSAVLVGSMVDGTSVGMPEYDMQLPVLFEGAQFNSPYCGRVEARVTKATGNMIPGMADFVIKGQVDAAKVSKYVHKLVEEAVDYYRTMTGKFPKHSIQCNLEDQSNRITLELIDKRDGDHTLSVHYIPMLHLSNKEGDSFSAVPELQTDGSTSWKLNFIERETTQVKSWEKEKTDTGCRRDCLRLLKGLIISRYPEIPSSLGKAIMLKEIVDTKNSDSVWNHEELSERFVYLVKKLEEGLRKKQIFTIHTKQQGGDINLLDGVKPEAIATAHKRLVVDLKGTANAMISLIKVAAQTRAAKLSG